MNYVPNVTIVKRSSRPQARIFPNVKHLDSVIMLGPRSAQIAHNNGKLRIIKGINAQISHPYFSSIIALYRKTRIKAWEFLI